MPGPAYTTRFCPESECKPIDKDGLFVYVSPHNIYRADNGRVMSVGDLIRSRDKLYITGHPRICDIIPEIYDTRDIYICSPYLWLHKSLSVVLRFLPTYKVSPLNGGFRKLTEEDLMLMRTRACVERGDAKIPDDIVKYAASHELVRKICFLQNLTPLSSWIVMSWIIDPRWFCQARISPKQLESYFFLTPHQASIRWIRMRFLTLYRCWYKPEVLDRIRHLERLGDYSVLDNPRNYLYRRWVERLAVRHSITQAGTYVASIVLSWIFYQWMDAINPQLRGWFFNPSVFFNCHKDAEEEYRAWSNCAS